MNIIFCIKVLVSFFSNKSLIKSTVSIHVFCGTKIKRICCSIKAVITVFVICYKTQAKSSAHGDPDARPKNVSGPPAWLIFAKGKMHRQTDK